MNGNCSSTTGCNISDCVTCYTVNGTEKCQDCAPGFSVNSSGGCSTTSCNIAYCNLCNTNNSQVCDSCASGYTANPEKTGCVAVCDDAKCTSCLSPNFCGACQTGYMPNNGVCEIDCSQSDIVNCTTCTSLTACTGCITGYKVVLGGTLCAPICNDANCLICSDPNAGSCTSCKLGYGLQSNGTCA